MSFFNSLVPPPDQSGTINMLDLPGIALSDNKMNNKFCLLKPLLSE